jgi:streptogramin lyase
VKDYTFHGFIFAQAIAAGPDGALWFTNPEGSIGRITTAGVVTIYHAPSFFNLGAIAAGPDGALWFTSANAGANGSIERITTAGTVTNYPDPRIVVPQAIVAGPDGAIWFTSAGSIGHITTADSVTTSPTQGPSGSDLTVTGAGFASSETITVEFRTGLPSPAYVPLCAAIAAPDGTFSCIATVPATAGGAGTHKIRATGQTSGTQPRTVFLLTT